MKSKRLQVLASASILLTFFLVDPISAEPLDGEALYKKHRCAICHGAGGRTSTRDGYPIVAGQNRLYLVDQIMDIRDGFRDNGKSQLMRPLIKTLSREEIEAIADFLSSQE